MDLNADTTCMACNAALAAGTDAEGAKVGGKWSFLCPSCWSKVERGGRTPRQTIEAILLSYDPDFGGPDDTSDHEDLRDLERLGLWPDAE